MRAGGRSAWPPSLQGGDRGRSLVQDELRREILDMELRPECAALGEEAARFGMSHAGARG